MMVPKTTTDLATDLDDFVTRLFAAVEPALETPGQRRVLDEAQRKIGRLSVEAPPAPQQVAACSWLDRALKRDMGGDALNDVARALGTLAPGLSWYDRPDATDTGSANFATGHGNALIVGPDGLVRRPDLWIGVTLLAPHVRYPDHTHPPEELYLALSDGEFRNAATDWTRLGSGGLFHNPPGILHAMRSGGVPQLAVWMLVPAA